MLIIGHRGAAGLAPENTLESLQAGLDAGADILEFDIRLTADSIPILAHDPKISGHQISQLTLAELQQSVPITTLQSVLDTFFGKILLNIELKQTSGVNVIYDLVCLYITKQNDWDKVLFSSFKTDALLQLRSLDNELNLALLHHINPFLYMRYQRRLHLSAVGWHRLHVNGLALAVAKELGLFTYVYTVDRPDTAQRFDLRKLDGLVTNYPDRIAEVLQADA